MAEPTPQTGRQSWLIAATAILPGLYLVGVITIIFMGMIVAVELLVR
jgi:hypothetical protein